MPYPKLWLAAAAALFGTLSVVYANDLTVGAIYVGPKDDYGYNQAHALGITALKGMTGVKVIEEASVPETVAVQQTMKDMINQDGATVSVIDQGADVVTCHVDSPKVVIQTAENRGAYTCGYHASQAAIAPKGYLTGAEWNWSQVYQNYIRDPRHLQRRDQRQHREGCDCGRHRVETAGPGTRENELPGRRGDRQHEKLTLPCSTKELPPMGEIQTAGLGAREGEVRAKLQPLVQAPAFGRATFLPVRDPNSLNKPASYPLAVMVLTCSNERSLAGAPGALGKDL